MLILSIEYGDTKVEIPLLGKIEPDPSRNVLGH